MTRTMTLRILAAIALAIPVQAETKKPAPASDNYDVLYQRYLASARSTTTAAPTPASSVGWMAGLVLDPRARSVNDLITIQVIENISAAGSADASLNKDSSGAGSISKFFGVDSKLPSFLDPTNLADTAAKTDFKGGGATSRTGALTARITARVVEVLPNGDLVLEGAREIDINGDRQIVVLTGVVRPSDVGRDNVVQSTQIGQFRIRYFGRGLIRDNLKPGWLIRVLNMIF